MTSILPPNELCSNILNISAQLLSSENISHNSKNDETNSKFSNDFREQMIPQLTQFPKKELLTMSNQLKFNEKQFTAILNEHNFSFSWSTELIKKVSNALSDSNVDSNTKTIACLTQMHSCLSILIQPFNNPTLASDQENYQKYMELISSLLLSLQNPFVNQNSKLNAICNSCFIYLMRNYLQLNDFDDSFALKMIETYYSFIENSALSSKKKMFGKKAQFIPSFILISDIGKALVKKHSEKVNDLVEFTDKLMQNYPNTFPKETAISFTINVLKLSTSYEALQCFHHLLPIVGVDTLQVCVPLFVNSIIHYSALNTIEETEEKSEIITLPQVSNHQSQPFSIIDWNTFNSKLEFNKLDIEKRFPKIVDLEESLPDQLMNAIKEIKSIFSEASALIPTFVKLVQDYFCSDKCNDNLFENASFIYLILTLLKGDGSLKNFDISSEIQCSSYSDFPVSIFLNPTVIDSSNTIFASHINQNNYTIVNTLRTLVLSLFIENGIPSLNTIFYDVIYNPYLFAEFTYRLSMLNFKLQKDDVVVLSQMFMYAMKYYQQLRELDEKQLNAINVARKSIFYFFNVIFEDNSKMMQLFRDVNFIENYLSCTFEYYPRIHILDQLSKYYGLSENLTNNECVKKMNQLIIISLNSIDNQSYVGLCSDYIRMIIKIIQKNRLLGFYFVPIIPVVCQKLSKLEKNSKVSQEFLFDFIKLLTVSIEFHIMTDSQVLQLQNAIISSFGNEPPPNLFKLLVNLMAGQENNSLSFSFYIQQPAILRILISVYLNSKICLDLFMFIAKLCQFSTKNCVAAHNGEADLLLLDILYQWRNDPSISVNVFASAMSLFMLIAKTISSLSIVQKFWSLFSPIHRKYLPKYHCIVMKSMANILESAQKRPFSCFPLQNSAKFEFSGLKGEMIEKGFTLAAWIFNFSNKEYKAQILSLNDSHGQRLTIMQSDNGIMTIFDFINKSNSKPQQWSFSTDFKLYENAWNFITITIENQESGSILTITLNSKHSCQSKINLFRFTTGIFGCIGGFTTKGSDPSLLKSISIFHILDNNEIKQLYHLGHTGTVLAKGALCKLTFDEKDGQTFIQSHNSEDIVLKNESIPLLIPDNFCSIYIKKCTMNMIVPLFAQLGLTYENGENVPNLPNIAFDVLKNSLILLSETQNHFASPDDFKILLHLLLSLESSILTYKTYIKLYEIFQAISDKQSKECLFTYILMNINLVMKLNSEDHLKILKLWSEILIPSNINLAVSKKPLQWIFSILRTHYWYTPIENTIIVAWDNRGSLNVNECRKCLFKIAKKVANYTINEDDFKCIISNILTCADKKQCLDMLKFLHDLISECENTKLTKINVSKIIALLQYSFNCNNEKMVCTVFEIIALAHRKEIISEYSLTAHIDIILHQLSSSYVTNSLLSHLLQITKNDFPELFSICSWIALNLGNNAVREMLNTLKPSKIYETNEFWAIWLVVALYKSDEKLQTFIARYLIKCSKNFQYIFATCEIVGNALHENPDNIKKIVVMEYGKLLLRDDYEKDDYDVVNYFCLNKHYLFYHREPQKNKKLEQLYMSSPFVVDDNFHHVSFSEGSPKKALRKERRRKERHSIRRDSIDNNFAYTHETPQETISILIPNRSALYDDCIQPKSTPINFKSKRTSMLTVRQNVFCSPKKKISDKKILSMTPIEFDTIIRSIASQEISYTFGLKLDENMEWLDLDIAKQAISVFQKFPDSRVSEIMLLICSFLIHYSFDDVRSIITKISIHSKRLNNNYCFFLHHCQLAKIKTKDYSLVIEKYTREFLSNIESSADNIISTSPLRFLKHLLKFQSSNSTISMDICELMNEAIVGQSSTIIANYADENAILIETSKQLWNQNWHNMTMDKAPWHRSISNAHEIHFKRDFTLCSNMCPSKLTRNYCFDDHMKASLVRDVGDCESAQEYLDKYKDELSKQYKDKEILPLFDVIEDKTNSNNANDILSETIEVNDTKCILELPCEFIKMKTTKSGTFSLFTKSIILTKSEKKSIVIDLNDVTNVLLRTRFHHPTAIEIFTTFGKTYFINFPNVKALTILKGFKSANLPRNARIQNSEFYSYFQNTKLTEQWINRKISNFEYLMYLNILSGRSFNDASQYPVIPWVINDYSSDKCDFSDPNFFRDLTKPIGATNEERLSQLIDKYEQLESIGMDSYLYSNGLVCPLSVYLWLLRQEPFTSLHIDIQSGKFDHAARLFSSIETSYFVATNHQNDFRELIPEFYSSPEFLLNSNKFDLGSVNGIKVGDVELPKWASNVFEFVYLMRKALESDYVSDHINQWIDLVWGEKQKGKKAKAANNVYLKEMYEDIWTPENLADPEKRAHIEAILCHVGQVPPQLFDKPHPQRASASVPPSIINKPIKIQMPTSHLITSSIDLTSLNTKKCIIIYAVDLSGQLIEINLPLSIFNNDSEKRIIKLHKSSSGFLQSKEVKLPAEFVTSSHISKPCQTAKKDIHCKIGYNKFGLVSANGYDLLIADPDAKTTNTYIHHNSEIVALSTTETNPEWIVIADKDASLSLYYKKEMKAAIQTFMKSITCLSFDFGFKEIVCGTSDNSLLFCSVTSNSISITRVIELEDFTPSKVIITKGWGFVVVYLTRMNDGNLCHYLNLYSINGDLIKQVEIQNQIEQFETYKNNDGFDFIIAKDNNNRLYSFEAFYLNMESPFYIPKSEMSTISFIFDKSLSIQISRDGEIIFVPYNENMEFLQFFLMTL